MRTFAKIGALACQALIVTAAHAAKDDGVRAEAPVRVAIVDFERVVKLHPNTAEDRKAIEAVYNSLKEEGEAKAAKVAKAVKSFEEAAKDVQSPVLSEVARKKAEEEAKKKYELAKIESDELKQLEDLHRMQLSERERKFLSRTTDAIREVVKKIATERRFTIVLPTAPILYFDDALDITGDVLKALGVDPNAVVPADDDAGAAAPKTEVNTKP